MKSEARVKKGEIQLDKANAEFWNELCGTGLAKSMGLVDKTTASLERFDQAYFGIYPYLKGYLPKDDLASGRVLEIGLGYGTLSQFMIESGADYHGLDISEGPVAMVKARMNAIGKGDTSQVTVGSAIDIPYQDGTFDVVVSIGCLHHAGDLRKTVDEVCRVLAPGGKAVVMIYNKKSLRQLMFRLRHPSIWFRSENAIRKLHANYDVNSGGEAAPHIDYTSPKDLGAIFSGFGSFSYEIRNIDPIRVFWKTCIPRDRLLNNIGRVLGLDLYITALK